MTDKAEDPKPEVDKDDLIFIARSVVDHTQAKLCAIVCVCGGGGLEVVGVGEDEASGRCGVVSGNLIEAAMTIIASMVAGREEADKVFARLSDLAAGAAFAGLKNKEETGRTVH